VYDFKNPREETGFHWSTIDPEWERWSPEEFRKALHHPVATKGFMSDIEAMKWADVGVFGYALWTVCSSWGRLLQWGRKMVNHSSFRWGT